MMKELYYYVPCEYWYDKQDRLRTDIEGRNTPMYMLSLIHISFACYYLRILLLVDDVIHRTLEVASFYDFRHHIPILVISS